jgi:hypothetical protein
VLSSLLLARRRPADTHHEFGLHVPRVRTFVRRLLLSFLGLPPEADTFFDVGGCVGIDGSRQAKQNPRVYRLAHNSGRLAVLGIIQNDRVFKRLILPGVGRTRVNEAIIDLNG